MDKCTKIVIGYILAIVLRTVLILSIRVQLSKNVRVQLSKNVREDFSSEGFYLFWRYSNNNNWNSIISRIISWFVGRLIFLRFKITFRLHRLLQRLDRLREETRILVTAPYHKNP